MELFKFDGDDIKRHIQYEMRLLDKMEASFEYVFKTLTKIGYHKNVTKLKKIDFNKYKCDEGKNYNWYAITSGAAKLLIRTYGTHFTIYTKNVVKRKLTSGRTYDRSRYSAFTLHSNRDKMSDDMSDSFCDDGFQDLNTLFPSIVEHVLTDKIHSLWNNLGFPRPDHCDVKNVYDGESIISVDKIIFCGEELSNIHMSLYAQNEILEALKSLGADVIGKTFSGGEITEIITEFPKQYSDPYYHGVGIVTKKKDKIEFADVYSIAHWHLEELASLKKVDILKKLTNEDEF